MICRIYREDLTVMVEVRSVGHYLSASLDGPEEWPELEILSVDPDVELTESELVEIGERVSENV